MFLLCLNGTTPKTSMFSNQGDTSADLPNRS
jgi:hypothetical protein